MLETASHEDPFIPSYRLSHIIKYSYIDHMYLNDKATWTFII